jgi:L-rhamnose mutarotase
MKKLSVVVVVDASGAIARLYLVASRCNPILPSSTKMRFRRSNNATKKKKKSNNSQVNNCIIKEQSNEYGNLITHPLLSNMSSSSSPVSKQSNNTIVYTAAVAVITTAFTVGYLTAINSLKWKRQNDITIEQQQRDEILDTVTAGNMLFKEGIIPPPRRFGACIKLIPEKYMEYRTLHDNVWDNVQKRIYLSHIRNFNIYYHKETSTLYQSFEWIGHWDRILQKMKQQNMKNDSGTTSSSSSNNNIISFSIEEEQELLDSDFKAIGLDPITRDWWKLCEPCQQPFQQWYEQEQVNEQDKDNDDDSSTTILLPSQGNMKGDWWSPMECICHTGHYPIAYSLQTYDPDFNKME